MKNQQKLSSFSIIVVFTCLVIIGASFLPLLNLQLNPSNTASRLNVSYQWHNASARLIEQEVTSKLEGLFSAVKGINAIYSQSYKGRGNISIEYKDNVDIDAARFEIASLVRQVYPELPRHVSYPHISLSAAGNRKNVLLSYTLSASASPIYIQKFAEEQIMPELSKVEGVSEVSVYGATPYEWEINYRVTDIQNLGISVTDIHSQVQNFFQSQYLGKGNVSLHEGQSREMGMVLRFDREEEFSWNTIPIKKVGDRVIYLGDIADIRFKEQIPNSYFRINGLNTINMVIFSEPDANAIRVGDKVKSVIQDQIKQQLPIGYTIIKSQDTTDFLKDELRKIFQRAIFSLVILLAFVLIVSRQLRYLLLILISVVANLAIAAIFYYIFKVEIHLYSLAGITISFGIIIDNSIVMIDHLRHTRNKRVFLAILAATITTIGALAVVFLLDEEQRLNLIDFAWVIIINLGISSFMALFFIPALMEKLPLKSVKGKRFFKRKRKVVALSGFYLRFISFNRRFRWAYLLLFLLGFGIPVHWAPKEIEGESAWAKAYNKTLGTAWFQEDARPILEKVLGGSWRLFTTEVFENAYYSEPSRTTLNVRGNMPEGCTIAQLNEAMQVMENFISQFDEVEVFQTNIYDIYNANITINFKPEHEFSSFPYYLKSQLESKVNSLGGMDWTVTGVGRGFSNALATMSKSQRIVLEGYNYDELYRYAELLQAKLLENNRIKEVEIAGEIGWNSYVLHEYFLDFNKEALAQREVSMRDFYVFLRDRAYRNYLAPVYSQNEMQWVVLVSDRYEEFNTWSLNNEPIAINDRMYKLSEFATLDRRRTGNNIYKNNQQYSLIVAYDFIGPYQLAKIVQEDHVEQIEQVLPLGYSVKVGNWGGWWDKDDKKQYYLILVVIVIIYFASAILFESLLQPLVIITLIPISFIGSFLTFYLFDINFDQGGYASFIMLSGLAVNAGIFIINDFNNFRKSNPNRAPLSTYIKAFNHKIIPIFLTIISTVVGLIPFIWGGQNEVFWFAFASGVIGGLLFSVIAIIIYLPLLLKLNPKR